MKIEMKIKAEFDARFLVADMGVRYWEDATVNGVDEGEDFPTIPCVHDGRWKIKIDLDTGRIEGWPQGTTAETHYKVCDDGIYTLIDANGREIASREHYVPRMLSPKKNGYGDYVIMQIDADGQIVGWNPDLSFFTEDA